MLTTSPNASAVTDYTKHLLDECVLDRALPKDPWFHNAAYLNSAYSILDGFLHGDWSSEYAYSAVIDLHDAPDGVSLEVAVDLIGSDPDEYAVGGIAYLTVPNVGDLRLALAKAVRDTDLYSTAYLTDPAGQINYLIGAFCKLIDQALAPVHVLLAKAST